MCRFRVGVLIWEVCPFKVRVVIWESVLVYRKGSNFVRCLGLGQGYGFWEVCESRARVFIW